MLIKIDDTGRSYPVEKIPYEPSYRMWVNKFSNEEFASIKEFLFNLISKTDKFSVATLLPKKWENTPLIKAYEITGCNTENAGLLVGRIVLDLVIGDEEQWLCTKTSLKGRDLKTAFYWKPR